MKLKAIKVFAGDQRLKDIYPYATKWQVFKYKTARLMRKMFILSLLIASLYGAYVAGSNINPVKVYADREVQVPVESASPVLDRIANCESGRNQTSPTTGQLLIKINTNGTVDAGYMQINSVNFAQATKLGLDITKKEDNIAFGKWLYANRGTEPWASSKACWNK